MFPDHISPTELKPLQGGYGDVVQIETGVSELGRASLSFGYRICREAIRDHLATGSTKHACIAHSGKVTRIPNILSEALKALAKLKAI
jgi:acyl-CoA thioesterase FadM